MARRIPSLRAHTRWPMLGLLLALAPLVCGQSAVNASGGLLIPSQAAYDVEHYRLILTVSPERREIAGRVVMTARLVEDAGRITIDLDHRLLVSDVQLDGENHDFERDGDRIHLDLGAAGKKGRRIRTTVVYSGKPKVAPRPPWQGGFTWKKTKDGRPWIATTCQGEGGDIWWPCKDHPSDKPATMDLEITVPGGLFCASNGTLKADRKNEDGTRTLHWHIANPISNYNVSLNIAPYEVIETTYESVTGEKVPVFFWVRPESLKKAKKSLPDFLGHLRWFEETCGPYPFRNEKYGIVETPHLGMEHQTIIAYGNKFRKLAWNYDWLHHHELAHEWWANLVTCRDWKDMWIHEGIGTYMQPLYIEKIRGRKAYLIELMRNRPGLRNQRPIAPRESKNSKEIYFSEKGTSDTDIYYKGAWVMHTLRWLLEDEVFMKALRRLAYPDPAKEKVTDGSQVRFSDTEEVRAILEKVAQRDLAWFFEVYLRRAELPELIVKREGERVELEWRVPGNGPFPLPVPVEVDGEIRRVEMPKGRATLKVDAASEVRCDPDNLILRVGNTLRRPR